MRLAALNLGRSVPPRPGAPGRRPEAPHLGRDDRRDPGWARSRPAVSIQLGRRCRGIIEAARVYDSPGNRQYRLRQMLFSPSACPADGLVCVRFTVAGQQAVVRRAVRSVSCPTSRSARRATTGLVIDFPVRRRGPLARRGSGPGREVRENERQHAGPVLPFLGGPRGLGKLVIIDRLLLGSNLDQYAQHLSLRTARPPGSCSRTSRHSRSAPGGRGARHPVES